MSHNYQVSLFFFTWILIDSFLFETLGIVVHEIFLFAAPFTKACNLKEEVILPDI